MKSFDDEPRTIQELAEFIETIHSDNRSDWMWTSKDAMMCQWKFAQGDSDTNVLLVYALSALPNDDEPINPKNIITYYFDRSGRAVDRARGKLVDRLSTMLEHIDQLEYVNCSDTESEDLFSDDPMLITEFRFGFKDVNFVLEVNQKNNQFMKGE